MQLHMQQILNLINQNYRTKVKTTSIKLSQELVSSQQFDKYSTQLKAIYKQFFNDRLLEINISKVLPLKPYPTKMPICNKILNTVDEVYKCYDCFLHQSAVLCEKCFENGEHVGHRYKKINSGGGNCDCGNPQALKNSGFCKNHSGKAEIPNIPSSDIEYFLGFMTPIMDWFFKLKQVEDKENFSQVLFKFIIKLNEQSLYYNFLTEKLLISKRHNQTKTILQQSFHLQNDTIIKKFRQLYFAMFTLESFKITLANAYLTAYNTIDQFEKKPFQSLFIQLFANDTVVLEICNKYQNTLKITKKAFDYERYLQDLSFISSIQDEPAFAFYELYLDQNSTIPFTPLDIIQSKLQKSEQIHLVDSVSNHINQENFFYTLIYGIATKIRKNTKILIKFVKGIFLQIESQTYSYAKNKAVLPYHRAFAITLFALFKGNIEEMSIESIGSMLQVSKQRIINFYKKHTITVINCLVQFSETYARRTYFDNYVNLYAKSGVICINYDYLFIRQATEIMRKQGMFIQFHELDQYPNQTLDEYLMKHIFLSQIFIEACVSDLPLIILNQKMSLDNPIINKKRKELFISILKILKSVSLEELGILGKYFLSQIEQKFLMENTIYNKTTKKYCLKPELSQNASNFEYEVYISKKKTPQTLLSQNSSQKIVSPKQTPNANIPILISYKSVVKLAQKIINSKAQLNEKNSFETVIKTFKQMLHCLSLYVDSSYPLKQIDSMMSNVLPSPKEQEDSVQIEGSQKLRREMIKKKKQQAIKEKRKLAMQTLQLKTEVQDSSNTCLFCREQKNDEILCYFATVKLKKLRSNEYEQNEENKFGFIYNSCFHTVHESCSNNNSIGQNKIKCPLCKKMANILLPVYCQFMNPSFKKLLQRTNKILSNISQNQNESKNEFQRSLHVLKSFMSSIIQSIGYIGVFSKKEFENNFGRVCLEMTRMIKVMWKNWDSNQKQKIKKQLLSNEKQTSTMINEKDILFISIKQFITHKFLTHIEESSLEKSFQQKLTENINFQDLEAIQSNLSFIFNQDFQPNVRINSEQKQSLRKIIDHYNYFIPPLNVKQLLIMRDQTKITESNCKTGHNVLICCLCEKVVCQECKCMFDHIKQHGSETVYFSLLNGSIVLAQNKYYKMESFYENSLGLPWAPDKEPDNFELNLEDYNDLILSFLFHCVNSYLRKTKKITPATLNNYEDLLNIF